MAKKQQEAAAELEAPEKFVVLCPSFDEFSRGDVIDLEKAGNWDRNVAAGWLRPAKPDECDRTKVALTDEDLPVLAEERYRRAIQDLEAKQKVINDLEFQLAQRRSDQRVEVVPPDYESTKKQNAALRTTVGELQNKVRAQEAELEKLRPKPPKGQPPKGPEKPPEPKPDDKPPEGEPTKPPAQ